MPPKAADPDLPARPEVRRIAATLGKPVLTLKDYHAIGEALRRLADDPALGRRGTRWRERVAAAVGCSPSTLTKALQFHSVYPVDDLSELEALGVGWSRLTIVLGISDKRQRHRMLRTARDRGWADRQLQRALQQLRGIRRGGGRPRRPVASQGLLADLSELARLTDLWLDFVTGAWAAGHATYAAEAGQLKGTAAEAVRQHLDDAERQLKRLTGRAREVRQVVRELRVKVPAEQ